MIQYQLDANVSNLKLILEEMASNSENILKAGSDGDEQAVRQGVDRMRQLNSDLQGVGEIYKTYFDTRPDNEKARIGRILEQYKKSEDFCKTWARRYENIAPLPVLLELPDGPGGIVDMYLPEAWDWNNDVIIFSNRSDRRLIDSVLDRGQRRILIYCVNAVHDEDKIPGAVYVDEEKQIYAYFQNSLTPSRIFIFDKLAPPIPAIESDEEDAHQDFVEIVHKAFQRSSVNRSTVRLFGNRWINQGVENLPIIAQQPSYKHLIGKLTKVPLVIISPGPSLDKNIKQLHELKERAVLVSPAQTVMALQREGIIPDIVMVADPCDLLYLLEDFDMSQVKAILIGVSCNPSIYKRYIDKIISFNVNGAIDAWISNIFNDTPPPGGCGSVSSMAFMLANELKCDPIILVGQDLSFAGEKQYSEGTYDGTMTVAFDENSSTFSYTGIPQKSEELMKTVGVPHKGGKTSTLPGYYGGLVQTKFDYAIFHGEFERLAARYLSNENPPKLLNCTEGGAYIKGLEHIALQQAIQEIKNSTDSIIDKRAIFEEVFNSVEKSQRLKSLEKVISEVKSALQTSILLSKECHAQAVKIEKGKAQTDELSKIEMKLMREIKTSNFISIAVQDEIRNAIKLADQAKTLKQNIGASKLLYKLVMKEAKKIEPYVLAAEKTINRIKNELSLI